MTMQQISMFEDGEQETGASAPFVYTESTNPSKLSRRSRGPSASQVVEQLRRRVESLTSEFDSQSAIRDDLRAHLARSAAGTVDEVWMEALIRMGAIPLEIAAHDDDSEPTYFVDDDNRYCPAICNEIQLHLHDLTEELERLGQARNLSQKELDDLFRLTSAT